MRLYIVVVIMMMQMTIIEVGLSQPNFNKSYPNDDGQDIGWALAQDSTGYIISSGSLCNNNSEPCDNIIRTDLNGNLIWQSKFGQGNVSYTTNGQHSIISEPDGIVLFGSVQKRLEDDLDYYLMKLDHNGDSIWLNQLDQLGHNVSRQIHKAPNSSDYYLFGTYRGEGEGEVYIQVTRVDRLGNLIWQKNILGDYERYWLSSTDPIESGGFLIGATAFHLNSNDEYLEMIRIDDQGEVVWTFTNREEEYHDCDLFYAQWLPNNTIMYKECRDTSLSVSSFPNNYVLIDTLGNEINRTITPVWGDRYIQFMTELSNGDVLAMGNTVESMPVGSDNRAFDVAYAVRIGQEGGIVWERFYNLDPDENVKFEQFLDAVETPDGSIVFTGSHNNPYEIDGQMRYIYDTWLFKVDGEGCYEPDCSDQFIILSSREAADGSRTFEQTYFLLYPNPVSSADRLTLSFPHGVQHTDAFVTVRDGFGRRYSLAEMRPGELEYQVDLSDFPSGMYFVSYYREGRILQTERVVVD